MISELILKCRSFRRFYENEKIELDDLREMVNNARLSASARNMQPLKYMICYTEQTTKIIFPCLAWAGYLKDWPGPEAGERPSAYIIQLNDTQLSTNYYCDHGIAAQSILLTAVEMGFGGCIIANISREKLKKDLQIADHLEIIQIIALGKPKETVVIEHVKPDGDIKYWRDEQQIHHVPKRSITEIIVNEA